MKKSKKLILVFLSSLLFAQDYELNGYVKLMPSFQEIKITETAKRWDLINNNRLRLTAFLSENFEIKIENKLYGFYGDTKRSSPDMIKQLKAKDEYFDLNLTIKDANHYFILNRIDRLSLEFITENSQLSIGRQRVSWGTSLVWNPIDLFNPSSPLDFDNEEKNGADAIRYQYFLDYSSSIDFAYKHAKNKDFRNLAIKYMNSFENYDIHILAGYQREYPYFGLAWAGDISGAGFRGEFVYHHSQSKSIKINEIAMQYSNKSYLIGNISLDYTFESSLYLHIEALYHQSAEERLNLVNTYVSSLSQSTYSLFFETAYQITDLSRLSTFVIDDPDKESYSLLSAYSNSLFENIDLAVFLLYTRSANGKQLGVFSRFKYSF